MRVKLSFHQERLFFIDQFEAHSLYPSHPLYHNIPVILQIDGSVEAALLEKSFTRLIGRHEALRTRVGRQASEFFQKIDAQPHFRLEVAARPEGPADPAAVQALLLEKARTAFDLEQDSLIRATWVPAGKDQSFLLILLHHCIADPFCASILTDELLECYRAELAGNAPDLPELPLQYADFSEWQRELPEDMADALLFYWKQTFGRVAPLLVLPADHPRLPVQTFRPGQFAFRINPSTAADLKQFAARTGYAVSTILLAAFKILLFRYSGQPTVIVGTFADNRQQPELAGTVGPLANLVPVGLTLEPGFHFAQVLAALHGHRHEMEAYGAVPFEKLVAGLQLPKDLSRSPLFDVLFQCRPQSEPRHVTPALRVNRLENNLGWGKYDLNLLMLDGTAAVSGIMAYNSLYYSEATVQEMVRNYAFLLQNLLAEPGAPLAAVPVYRKDEKAAAERVAGATVAATIDSLFAQQAARTPDRVALVKGDLRITYRTLDAWADQLAGRLLETGLQPGQYVGILLDKSFEMVVAVLAALKAGAAYLPLDPEYPRERIRFMLADSGCTCLVSALPPDDPSPVPSIAVEPFDPGRPRAEVRPANDPRNVAYLMYTSGTTGQPKGCLVRHESVVSLLHNSRTHYPFGEGDVWVMAHSFCFDISVWEMFGALLFGGTLVLPEPQQVRIAASLLSLVKRNRVTVLNQTPAAFYNLVEEEQKEPKHVLHGHLRYVMLVGDKLTPSRLCPWRELYPAGQIALVNMYGPTETTIYATSHRLSDAEITPGNFHCLIGRPLPGYYVKVLDAYLHEVPPLVTGEVYIGGVGVANGYLNREDLTRERFLPDPEAPGQTLYRTGDLGRRLADGTLEFLGRTDRQVKIRGFRVETGEIESALSQHPAIGKAIVTVHAAEDDTAHLIAYYTSPDPVEQHACRTWLRKSLPEYMIPALFVRLETVPLTGNGKVDYKALPPPETYQEAGNAFVPPRDALEAQLLAVWQGVLHHRNFGVTDNFFEVGGHSLMATRMITWIYHQLHVDLDLKFIFQHPTIEEIAREIEATQLIAAAAQNGPSDGNQIVI